MFLSIVRGHQPDYQLNHQARGARTECVRRAEGEWYTSQNSICIRGRYSHGFALLLAPPLTDPYLFSPYVAGGRFDHNNAIAVAFERQLGLGPRNPDRPKGVHSTHERRAGAEEIVRGCTANAEIHLAPYYAAMLARAAGLLLRLTEDVVGIRKTEPAAGLASRYSEMRAATLNLRLEDFAGSPHPFFTLPEPHRHYALAGFQPELFNALEPHFSEILATLSRLSLAADC
jgi:hypothetical protein